MELDFRKNPGILSNMVDVMADGVFTVDVNGNISWHGAVARRGLRGIPAKILWENPAIS